MTTKTHLNSNTITKSHETRVSQRFIINSLSLDITGLWGD